MSDNNLEKNAKDLANIFKEAEAAEKNSKALIEEINKKSLEVKEFEVNRKYKQVQEAKSIQEKFNNLNINFKDPERIKKIIENNTRYLENARTKSMEFLNPDFDEVVPYQPGQLILVGARTGKGKTTTVANLAHRTVLQGLRGLVLSNEEKAADVYNRVTAIIKEKAYTNHRSISPEEAAMYNDFIQKLDHRLTVIDDDAVGTISGMSTLEVIKGYVNKAIEEGSFDVIMIDYYQKINTSAENPSLDMYQVQHKFADYLGDVIKNPAAPPIVLFVQLKPDDKDGIPFEERIEGRKIIVKPATCMLEAKPNYDQRCTDFICHKSRFSESNGKIIKVGFLKGKFVRYSAEWEDYVMKEKQREHLKKLEKAKLSQVKPSNGV